MRRYPNMSAADRDRCEEEEAEVFDTLFETVHARMTREYYENGGTGDYKPEYAKVSAEVNRILDARQSAGAREAAEDRADVARMFSKI
jgi:hypothetical protein